MSHYLRPPLQRASYERATAHAGSLVLAVGKCEQTSAFRARHRKRAIPDGKRACRVVSAAIKQLRRLARLALYQVAAAIRTYRARLHHERFLEIAFGKA